MWIISCIAKSQVFNTLNTLFLPQNIKMNTFFKFSCLLLVLATLFNSVAIAQNVGIGETAPANKLAVKGSLSVGSGYSTTTAPTNGAIFQGNVGIGNSSPNANAILDLSNSSSKGLLLPSGSSLPSSPATGMMYYNTSTGCMQVYNGSSWSNLALSSTSYSFTSASASATLGNTGLVYTVTPGASAYSWTVPNGWSITSGSGTNSITVSLPANNTASSIGYGGTQTVICTVVSAGLCGGQSILTTSTVVHGYETFAYSSSNQSFSVSTGFPAITAYLWGGGGAGGSNPSIGGLAEYYNAGGGGGGACLVATISAPSGTYTISGGKGGAANTSSPYTGGAGATMQMTNGGNTWSAGGGSGGLSGNSSGGGYNAGGAGASTGSAPGSYTVYNGGNGSAGYNGTNQSNDNNGMGGGAGGGNGNGSAGTATCNGTAAGGGSAPYQGGAGASQGCSCTSGSNCGGNAGGTPGGGGGGSFTWNSNTSDTGGAGGNGQVIIAW